MTPAVRARVSQVLLRAGTEGLPHGLASEVRATISEDSIARIEASNAFSWIALDEHLPIVEGIRRVLGDAEYRARMEHATHTLLGDSLLHGLALAAVRHVGATPNGLLRFASVGFGATFRACGTLVHREIDRGHARVSLVGFPAPALESGTFALGLAGTLDAVIGFAGQFGRTMIVDASGGRATFELSWQPNRSSEPAPHSDAAP